MNDQEITLLQLEHQTQDKAVQFSSGLLIVIEGQMVVEEQFDNEMFDVELEGDAPVLNIIQFSFE